MVLRRLPSRATAHLANLRESQEFTESADATAVNGRLPRLVFSLALALTMRVGVAHADEAEGKRQYRRGEALVQQERYRDAIDAFEAGYAASPRVGFLLDIANCYRKLGDVPRSEKYYWRFLDAAPKDHPQRREALEYLKTIRQIAADGVDVQDDATGPKRAAVPAASPPPGFLDAAPVANVDVRARAEAAESQPQRPIYARWWFWTGVGVAALAAGAGLWFASHGAHGGGCTATLGCLRE
jgi:tetratricopeptide (TPR) repeat protein